MGYTGLPSDRIPDMMAFARVAALSREKAVEISSEIRKEAFSEHAGSRVGWILPPPVLRDCEAIKDIRADDRKDGLDRFPVEKRVLRMSSFEKCLFRSRIVDSDLTGFSLPLLLVTMERLPVHPRIDDLAVRRKYNPTKREAEIVSYLFKGCRNAEIAEQLFISEGTVKNHLRNIFEKAGVKNRTALIHKVLSV